MDNMRHIRLEKGKLKVNLERNTFTLVDRIYAEVVNIQEDAIVQACIRFAKDASITDLFLIDEQFVKDALIEKITRDSIVRCKECKHRGSIHWCPMRRLVFPFEGAGHCEDFTRDDGYCHYGEKKEEENHDQG